MQPREILIQESSTTNVFAVHVEKCSYFINMANLKIILEFFYPVLKSSPVTHNVNCFLTCVYLEIGQETVFLLPEVEEHTKIISILHSILIKRTVPLTIFPLLCLYLCN